MFRFLLFIFFIGAIAGVWCFSSDSTKDAVKTAGTELVKEAADNAAEAALDKSEQAGKKVIARVKDIRQANKEKLMKK